jgi:hypothetical protein
LKSRGHNSSRFGQMNKWTCSTCNPAWMSEIHLYAGSHEGCVANFAQEVLKERSPPSVE